MNTENSDGSFFDDAAESWDENPKIVELAASVSENIIRHIPLHNQMDAMEFGCGTGLVSMRLAPELKKVTAVDGSEKMLGTLRRKIEHFNYRNIVTHRTEPQEPSLPFADKFDLVFSSMVFHHIQDTDNLLNMLYQTLRPKGYLAVADLDKEDGSFHEKIPDVYHFGFKREELVKKMKSAGFSYATDVTAHVFSKTRGDGAEIDYPVFLMIAQKE